MKIVCVDNFDREHVSDSLVVENIPEQAGKQVVDYLNRMLSGPHADRYYRLVEDSYKLYIFEP